MTLLEYFSKGRRFFDKQAFKPYIIAEAGVNHEGDMDLAKRLIEEAKEGGANAIKFQTYKAETIASKNSPSYWDLEKESTKSQFALFKKYDKFWKEEYQNLKKHCDEFDIEFLSTPFDVESTKFLNDLMDVFKISSSDITNFPFIEFICSFQKPIILSTGASNIWEIQQAADLIDRNNIQLCLMHCILNYPTKNENANLGMIHDLRNRFPEQIIGYSDHTLPGDMSILLDSVLLGSTILEKHFTHDKTLPGNDHYHAMDKEDLKLFWEKMNKKLNVLGNFKKESLVSEEPARLNARRSLVAKTKIKKGEIFTAENLTWKRPAHGISPTAYYEVLNKKASEDIQEDTILKWKMIEE